MKTTETPRRGPAKPLVLALLFLLVGLPWRAHGEPGLENMIFTAGTTSADGRQHWAYVLWQAGNPAALTGRSFAVYRKAGDANSTDSYTRRGLVSVQLDPAVIDLLLKRSEHLGANLDALEHALDSLFQKLLPPGAGTLPEKLAVVLRGSTGNPEHFKNVQLLARLHPGVCLCLGQAFAETIPDVELVTYELRQFDLVKNEDVAVVGRVTIQTGQPPVLPAPGQPAQLPEVNAKGDLNVKLRWATPDDLRRLSLLSYGYNVYRITKSFAEDPLRRFHLTPPTPSSLPGLLATAPAHVRRVNNLPILAGKMFNAATVNDFSALGDPTTYFMHDDNRRYETNGVPFADGAEYYYFVTARDILGRDGLVSPGRKVKICDRLPPNAPRGLQVENDYSYMAGKSNQVFRISWLQNTNGPEDTHLGYYVYRWTNSQESLRRSGPADLAVNRISSLLLADPTTNRLFFVDNGLLAPKMPDDANKTFWYTVRVVDNSSCGGNFSAHSGPAFGVLRDRVGPGAPVGDLRVLCCAPTVASVTNEFFTSTNSAPLARFTLVCERTNASVRWAEFYAFGTAPENFLARRHFSADAPPTNRVSFEWSLPWPQVPTNAVYFYCRTEAGGESSSLVANGPVWPIYLDPTRPGTNQMLWVAGEICQRQPLAQSCGHHRPRRSGSDQQECPQWQLTLSPGAREFKVYRRLDDGPLTLIEVGAAWSASTNGFDCNQPATPGEACYFAQCFDEHGNAGPLAELGCHPIGGTTPLPVPVLSPIDPAGSSGNPKMTLRWMCPPYGVDRFKVYVATPAGAPAENAFPELSSANALEPGLEFVIEKKSKSLDARVYYTPRIGPSFGNEAEFDLTLSGLVANQTYDVRVAALGKDDSEGDLSNAEEFKWYVKPAAGPQVPWPYRTLPDVVKPFHKGIVATNLNSADYPVGIRIGEDIPFFATSSNLYVKGQSNPLDFLYAGQGGPLFPLVVYRFQVTNQNFAAVSGDLVQVSPLMEEIAAQQTTLSGIGPVTVLHDPFIGLFAKRVQPIPPSYYDIYLLDTQPVISGARYAYLLVRFREDTREIDNVILTNEVEIP